MKCFVGIDLGEWIRVVAVTPERGIIAYSKYELPRGDEARSEKMADGVKHALSAIAEKVSSVEAVGIATSPPEEVPKEIISGERMHHSLPAVSGAPILFSGEEAAALFALFSPTPKRAWVVFGERARIYCEDPDSEGAFTSTDEQGKRRKMRYMACPWIMEPIRVLLDRLGLFESLFDIENYAGIITSSEGVRFSPITIDGVYDGISILGLKRGIRKPQLARAAMESVGAWIRYSVADLAGEGAITELYAAGADAGSDSLMSVIADVTGFTLARTEVRSAVASGAALRAAKAAGFPISRFESKRFAPRLSISARDQIYVRWLSASKL